MNTPIPIRGLHHVTALAKDPAKNIRFYTQVLGLRLIKRTVNFDDPGSYHFYFGDSLGRPGAIITFFPHPHAAPGAPGAGETARTVFAAPSGSLPFWRDRLTSLDVKISAHDDRRVEFSDHDGAMLAITQTDLAPGDWNPEGIPPEHALATIDHVVLRVATLEPTARFLEDSFGYRRMEAHHNRLVLHCAEGAPGQRLELLAAPERARPRLGAGSVHHVAFRVRDDDAQAAAIEHLAQRGYGRIEVRDRQYFHSIYFREPGGVIFEIATESPGFTIDEPADRLGEGLMLPPAYERLRSEIERALPSLSP